MRISGFSFVRNGVLYDYPFIESISSILPLCDEFVVAVGDSRDNTRERIEAIGSPKIRIVDTVWDENTRSGGTILADQTNIALQHIDGEWGFYLQGDEVIHEADIPIIRAALEQHHGDARVEGLLFRYLHFYGSHEYVGNSRKWYRHEVRIIRSGIGIESWGDAQGFRRANQKLHVKLIDASIYHYGWVKPPAVQQAKQKSFNRFWHDDEWVTKNVGEGELYDYSSGGRLQLFDGTHPKVMKERVVAQNWNFDHDPARARIRLKDRVLDGIENLSGWRIGEYKNYELI